MVGSIVTLRPLFIKSRFFTSIFDSRKKSNPTTTNQYTTTKQSKGMDTFVQTNRDLAGGVTVSTVEASDDGIDKGVPNGIQKTVGFDITREANHLV